MLPKTSRFPLVQSVYFNMLAPNSNWNQGANHSQKSFITYCGICPERALCTVLAGSPRRAGVLAEVVVPVNGSPAEVAHLSTAAA